MFTESVSLKGNLEVILLDQNGNQKDYRKVNLGMKGTYWSDKTTFYFFWKIENLLTTL